MSKTYQYSVVSNTVTNGETLVIVLRAEKASHALPYEPGQYAAISFRHHGRPTPARCFSITSSPTDPRMLRFAVHIGGKYTNTAVQALTPGAKVFVEGPFGDFIFNSERDQAAVFIAGGIGITPFMSMLRYANRLELTNNLALIYSCHSQEDVPFLEELILIQKANPRLNVVYVISHGPTDRLTGLQVLQGHIDQTLLSQVLGENSIERTYFICGPTGFMDGIAHILRAQNVPPGRILTEAFSQGQAGPRNIRNNIPLQIYAATGLGIFLGATNLLLHDVYKPAQYSLSAANQAQNTTSPSSSRQQAVDQKINNLTGVSNNSGSATASSSSQNSNSQNTSTTALSSTQTNSTAHTNTSSNSNSSSASKTSSSSSSTSTSKQTTPTPSPTPSPSPTPTPKPTPSPSPTPTPTPTPTNTSSGFSTGSAFLDPECFSSYHYERK